MSGADDRPRVWMLTPVAETDRDLFLSQLARQSDAAPDLSRLRVIAVHQSPDPGATEALATKVRGIVPEAEVVHQAEPSVSRARNGAMARCLSQAGPGDFVVFRDCRSLLDRRFVGALATDAGLPDLVCTATILWGDTVPPPGREPVGFRAHHDLIGRPTLAAFAFRPALLADIRFREDLGPGAETRIKAGEDVLFMAELLALRGDWQVRVIPGTLLLAPRADTNAKRRAYAAGQVYAARTLLGDPRQPRQVRTYARLRLWLFALGTIRFLRPGTMNVFRARLSVLLHPPQP